MSIPAAVPKPLAFFERYLTVWVLACMIVGLAFGQWLPGLASTLGKLEFSQGSQVNVPIGILLWLMILLPADEFSNRFMAPSSPTNKTSRSPERPVN